MIKLINTNCKFAKVFKIFKITLKYFNLQFNFGNLLMILKSKSSKQKTLSSLNRYFIVANSKW